ncbi:hypothetical protein ANANG_G00264470 [Anguilla anguilla]|uniref:Uncharacterized protein n=1 Tax=Anguilla anguilla TaxID=7936 RepID=A0A9D3LPU9_ANGAN|nr:hypothetical protein ANANG_G00264470 [Anguilla anguilla]
MPYQGSSLAVSAGPDPITHRISSSVATVLLDHNVILSPTAGCVSCALPLPAAESDPFYTSSCSGSTDLNNSLARMVKLSPESNVFTGCVETSRLMKSSLCILNMHSVVYSRSFM